MGYGCLLFRKDKEYVSNLEFYLHLWITKSYHKFGFAKLPNTYIIALMLFDEEQPKVIYLAIERKESQADCFRYTYIDCLGYRVKRWRSFTLLKFGVTTQA